MSPEVLSMSVAIICVFGMLLSVLICVVCYSFYSLKQQEKEINYIQWHEFRMSA